MNMISSRRPFVLSVLTLCLISLASFPVAGSAQSITSSGLNTQVSISATPPPGTVQYDITGGTRPGDGPNLFHSFGEFAVPANNIANFLNDSHLLTSNILGRVTGGNVSNILGTIQTTGFENANLFLINPAGVIFGAGASLNVLGALRVSTADYVRLSDGAFFYADLGLANATNGDSVLSSAPMAAFGFLAANPKGITVSTSSLEVPVEKTLSLVAGDLDIQGPSSSARPTLQARSGRVELVSVGSPGEVLLAAEGGTPALSTAAFPTLGTISLSNTARVSVPPAIGNATPGGEIIIRGGKLSLEGSSAIIASTSGNVSAPPVVLDVQLRGALTLDGNSVISATNTGTTSTGNAGAVQITAGSLDITNNAAINTFYFGHGNASDVQVTANTIRLASGGTFNGQNLGSSNRGNGGLIDLRASQEIYFGPQTSITAENFQGVGSGSQIVLTAPIVTLEGAGLTQQAIIKGFTGGSGAASSVTFNVGTLELKGTDAIVNTKAQNVSILGTPPTQGGGPIVVRGQGGAGTAANQVRLSGLRTAILSETEGQGSGGDMTFNATNMVVTNNARVSANTINAGSAGTITLNVNSLEVSNGGRIEGNTVSSGAGGTVVVQGLGGVGSSANLVKLTGTGSGLFSDAEASGGGGDIIITAGEVNLNGAIISASSQGLGDAGSISINSGLQFFSTNSAVTTRADVASGGDITVNAKEMIRLINSQINTSVAGGTATKGGNISIDPQFVILQNSKIVAQAFQGTGGNITIVANQFLSDPASLVDASSQLGVSGAVDIRAPITNLDGDIAVLPGNVLEVANLLQSSCLARMKGGQISSLIQRGRDEVPAEPGGPMVFPLFASAASTAQAMGHGQGASSGLDRSLVTHHDPDESDSAFHVSRFTLQGLVAGTGEFQIRGLSRMLAGFGGGGSCAT